MSEIFKEDLKSIDPYSLIAITLENKAHQKDIEGHILIVGQLRLIFGVLHWLGDIFGERQSPFCCFFRVLIYVLKYFLVDKDVRELEII